MSLSFFREVVALSYRDDACGCDTPGRQTTNRKVSGVERQAGDGVVIDSQILFK